MKKCLLDWCNKDTKPHGNYCSAHYEQYRKYGKFLTPQEISMAKEEKRKANIKYCKVCGEVAICKNLCEKHYGRLWRNGDPLKTKHTLKIFRDGYAFIKNWNHPKTGATGYMREHRLIMEKILNRYLLPEEIVHHKNGVKNDNRPDNLELIENQSKHINQYHNNS
jgi:hypothetical protein